MLFHLPQGLRDFRQKHKSVLLFILIEALPRYGSSIAYALLSVLIAQATNEVVAGIAFSAFAVYELLVSDPLGGALADRFGARSTLKLQTIFLFAASLILLFSPQNLWVVLLMGLCLFTAYGLRVAGTYLLRITKRSEGGLIFGLSENLVSLAYFGATLSIPFLAHAERASWVAVLLMSGSVVYLVGLRFLPNDLKETERRTLKERKGAIFNPLSTIKHGIHFIRRNDRYPLMLVANALFEGIFYSTVWFVFPLRMASLTVSGSEGFEMGIYDLVTMLLAGFCGYLADRYNWKLTHLLGWLLVAIGVVLLPIMNVSLGLIVAGFIIALGNNLSAFSASHILTKHDIDHREDGSFMALLTMVRSGGYVISPVITGYLYHEYGFSVSLWFACAISGIIALWMIWQTLKLKRTAGNG